MRSHGLLLLLCTTSAASYAQSRPTTSGDGTQQLLQALADAPDRKSTRLNSSHQIISYAVFCLKKKKTILMHITHSTQHPGAGSDTTRLHRHRFQNSCALILYSLPPRHSSIVADIVSRAFMRDG